ncbi:hypothetical protein [Jannaschia seosinensis]|nr:hypothetical protein [Jannaschia seosinensis]
MLMFLRPVTFPRAAFGVAGNRIVPPLTDIITQRTGLSTIGKHLKNKDIQ